MPHLFPPNPHPLDYDWRFDEETVDKLVKLLIENQLTLSMGVPSILRMCHELENQIYLVDRQPLHWSKFHSTMDPDIDLPLDERFHSAIIDPPWYLQNTVRWISWSAQHLKPGSKIYVSLWPEYTRPSATKERMRLFEWMNDWADFEVWPEYLRYETPLFEKNASDLNSNNLINDWRVGDLLVIQVKDIPALPDALHKSEIWHRFVINDYQLALRVRNLETEHPNMAKLSLANGWFWPSVSKRAEGRELIDLWSSDNEVASVQGSESALQAIRYFLGLSDVEPKSNHKVFLRSLQTWNIPNKPFKRVLEWQHLA
ncbi:hypothetical protein ACQKP8_08005 [Photobacterium alginatilyticum]|uniref:hypothetical protein n=1 Tax=Photobacterium alginatilyticum TaxID=1775171 RepID=UPI004068A551